MTLGSHHGKQTSSQCWEHSRNALKEKELFFFQDWNTLARNIYRDDHKGSQNQKDLNLAEATLSAQADEDDHLQQNKQFLRGARMQASMRDEKSHNSREMFDIRKEAVMQSTHTANQLHCRKYRQSPTL